MQLNQKKLASPDYVGPKMEKEALNKAFSAPEFKATFTREEIIDILKTNYPDYATTLIKFKDDCK